MALIRKPTRVPTWHQQNVNLSGSITQSSQTLRATSPVLLSTSRCSQTPLDLSKVLSGSARACSGAPECTCSYGGAFRMLWDLTYRIIKFWSFWDLCADLRKTSRQAETAAQLCSILRDCCAKSVEDLVSDSHSSGSFITTRHFVLSYLSLLHHNIACIIWVSLYIYIQSIWPQIVLEHNRRSTWTHPVSIQMEFMRKSGCSSRSVRIGWVDMISPGFEDPRNCMDPRNLGQSNWD